MTVIAEVVLQVGDWIIIVLDGILLSSFLDLGFAQNCSRRLRELNLLPNTFSEIFPSGNMYGGTVR